MGGAGEAVAFDQDWLAYIYSYGQPSWQLSLLNAGQIFSPVYTTFPDNFAVIVLTFADGTSYALCPHSFSYHSVANVCDGPINVGHLVSRGMDASPGGVIYLNDTFKGQSGIFQPIVSSIVIIGLPLVM
jgi:hypothetical protein